MTRLREISERLQAIADELEGEDGGGERAAELAREAAELSAEAVEETNRRIREAEAAVIDSFLDFACPGKEFLAWATPRTCAPWSTPHSAELAFSHASATAGLEEAMRYSLLAGGKRVRPVLALATRPCPRRRPRALPPGRLRDRADPHLLADPRRSAGDGRR